MSDSINVVVRCRGRCQREIDSNSPNIVKLTSDKVTITIPDSDRRSLLTNKSSKSYAISNSALENSVGSNKNKRVVNSPPVLSPTISNNIDKELQATLALASNSTTSIPGTINKTFTVDKVYGAGADQLSLFEGVAENICDDFLRGYNCTIMAYGQTGSGKTYTMFGDIDNSERSGVVPRCLTHLFNRIENNDDIKLKCSFVEIYNEEIKDLLNDSGKNLQIFGSTGNIKIKGLNEFHINNYQQGLQFLNVGLQKRETQFTKMNNHSSRSHTIFTISLCKKVDGDYQFSKMNLVDLAGSENVRKSGSINQRAKEAGSINQSLLSLGKVINSLVDGSKFIPYRESKLTRLLQDSLGGETKTTLIANVSPSLLDLHSTLSTLDYAAKAKNIQNTAQIGPLISEKLVVAELVNENRKLQMDLLATRKKENNIVMDTENYNDFILQRENLKSEVSELKEKNKVLNIRYQELQDLERKNKKLWNENFENIESRLVEMTNKYNKLRVIEDSFKNKAVDICEDMLIQLNTLEMKQQKILSVIKCDLTMNASAIIENLEKFSTDSKVDTEMLMKKNSNIRKKVIDFSEFVNEATVLKREIKVNVDKFANDIDNLSSQFSSRSESLHTAFEPIEGISQELKTKTQNFLSSLPNSIYCDNDIEFEQQITAQNKVEIQKMEQVIKTTLNQLVGNIVNGVLSASRTHHGSLISEKGKCFKEIIETQFDKLHTQEEKFTEKLGESSKIWTQMVSNAKDNISNISNDVSSSLKLMDTTVDYTKVLKRELDDTIIHSQAIQNKNLDVKQIIHITKDLNETIKSISDEDVLKPTEKTESSNQITIFNDNNSNFTLENDTQNFDDGIQQRIHDFLKSVKNVHNTPLRERHLGTVAEKLTIMSSYEDERGHVAQPNKSDSVTVGRKRANEPSHDFSTKRLKR